MKFEKRGTNNINFVSLKDAAAGDILISGDKFVGTKEVNGSRGSFTTYLFESDEGEVSSLPASGQLRYQMESESEVQIGERVQITYLGKKEVKGNLVNQFETLVAVPDDVESDEAANA